VICVLLRIALHVQLLLLAMNVISLTDTRLLVQISVSYALYLDVKFVLLDSLVTDVIKLLIILLIYLFNVNFAQFLIV